jgi:hypothetical protein
MMPHLGVLSTVHEKAATDVFIKDCLIPLGACVAPEGVGKTGDRCFSYRLRLPGERVVEGEVSFGEIRLVSLGGEEEAGVEVTPARGLDMGAGEGKRVVAKVKGGAVGLILDARGRPLIMAQGEKQRVDQLRTWAKAVNLYPEEDSSISSVSSISSFRQTEQTRQTKETR